MGEEEGAGARIVKLTAIVALDGLDGGAKLCGNISKEIRQSCNCVILEAQRKCPHVVRAITKNDQVVFKTRYTRNRRGPQITMYEIKYM